MANRLLPKLTIFSERFLKTLAVTLIHMSSKIHGTEIDLNQLLCIFGYDVQCLLENMFSLQMTFIHLLDYTIVPVLLPQNLIQHYVSKLELYNVMLNPKDFTLYISIRFEVCIKQISYLYECDDLLIVEYLTLTAVVHFFAQTPYFHKIFKKFRKQKFFTYHQLCNLKPIFDPILRDLN